MPHPDGARGDRSRTVRPEVDVTQLETQAHPPQSAVAVPPRPAPGARRSLFTGPRRAQHQKR